MSQTSTKYAEDNNSHEHTLTDTTEQETYTS